MVTLPRTEVLVGVPVKEVEARWLLSSPARLKFASVAWYSTHKTFRLIPISLLYEERDHQARFHGRLLPLQDLNEGVECLEGECECVCGRYGTVEDIVNMVVGGFAR